MRIIFESSVPLDLDPYETSVVEIQGRALAYDLFTDDCAEIKVATMSLYSVDYESIINASERDFFQIMDAISHSLMEISSDFYDNYGLKDKVTRKDPTFCPNLLHIEDLHVLKEFRGCGIGRVMFDRAMRLFGRTHGLITVKPYPLQIDGDRDGDIYPDLPTGKDQAQKKIEDLYKGWGFKKLRGSEYYYQSTYDWFENNDTPLNVELDNREDRIKALLERTGETLVCASE